MADRDEKKWITRAEARRILNVSPRGLQYLEKRTGIKTRIVPDSKYTNPEREYLLEDVERLRNRPRRRVTKAGTKMKAPNGYIYVQVPTHPASNTNGCVYEHRLVMEAHLGRYLAEMEVVHHKDGNRSNNAIENLELCDSTATHMSQSHELARRVLAACQNLAYRVKILRLLDDLGV